ncbi:MAG: integrase, partial [Pedobacter sp.]
MREKFLDYLQLEKRYSPHTVASYRKDLDDFYSFYLKTEGSENIVKADKKVIRNFMFLVIDYCFNCNCSRSILR